MWKNYLTVGLRALAKNRTYAFINIFGLAIGMAACLMILLFVRYEMSYDKWLPGAEQRLPGAELVHAIPRPARRPSCRWRPIATKAALIKDFPQIEKAVYALQQRSRLPQGRPGLLDRGLSLRRRQSARRARRCRSLHGSRVRARPGQHRRAQPKRGGQPLRHRRCRRPDDDRDQQGPALRLSGSPESSRTCRRTRTSGSTPSSGSTSRATWPRSAQFLTCWGCQGGCVYAKLRPGADAGAIKAALPAWEKRNIPDENTGEARFNAGDDEDWHFVNVARRPSRRGARKPRWRPATTAGTIVTFAIIALLILAMAVVNFTNLATARASQRAREVALRKVLGANRRQLIVQFIGESILVAALAMLIALALVELLLPRFSRLPRRGYRARLFRRGRDRPAGARPGRCSSACSAASIRLSSCRASSRRTVLKANKSAAEDAGHRPASQRRLSSASSRSRSASSSAPRSSTARPSMRERVDPGYRARRTSSRSTSLNRYQLIDYGRGDRRADQAGAGRRGGRPDHDRGRDRQPEQHQRHGARAIPSRCSIGIYAGRHRASSTRWASSWSPAAGSTRAGRSTT